jgi:rare lipoprotein A
MRIRLTATALLLACTLPLHAQTTAPAAPAEQAMPEPDSKASAQVSRGKVAYYGQRFAGRKTASGERFRPEALTMAHNTLPFGTLVRVTNPANKRSVVLRVNDRGPTTPDRIADLSQAGARALRMQRAGVIDAELAVVGQGKRQRNRRA